MTSMKHPKHKPPCPKYHGKKWITAKLPERCECWYLGKGSSLCQDGSHNHSMLRELQQAWSDRHWKWPRRPLYFFTDLHADTDAFLASLVASGGVKKTGPRDRDFRLTRAGRKAGFLIGGDCFDKGPSTLRLLRAIHRLKRSGAHLRILAGNHDVRLMLGIHALCLEPDPRTDHFFIRMGPKVVPLLKEVSDRYLSGKHALRDVPNTAACRRRLYPGPEWFEEFPALANWSMPEVTVKREVQRILNKMTDFERHCDAADLSLRQVYAAAFKMQKLLFRKGGEFNWFYQHLRLVHREHSLLFIHAGMDDQIARLVRDKGIKTLNRRFRKQMYSDPFEFYYGPLANTIRTKYRDVDRPWTRRGADRLHQAGIRALVHGHDNLLCGQRIMLRKGMLNFQCDATVDRNSRAKEGLKGAGAAVTIFHPDGRVYGVSTDYDYVKVFDPAALMKQKP